jgi:hypothetical protein
MLRTRAVLQQLVGALCGFVHRVVAVALNDQQGGLPDVAVEITFDRCRCQRGS